MHVCIIEGRGFSTWEHILSEDSLPELISALKDYAAQADNDSFLDILGTDASPTEWEAIEECWDTYVVPAIEKRELVKKIKLVEDNIAREELWFVELKATQIFKRNYIEQQRSVLKTLKEQQ